MFQVGQLLQMQLDQVKLWHNVPFVSPEEIDFFSQVTIQHHYNFELWHQEDLARDPDASDQEIAAVKRAIDILNQKRNDMIEMLDSSIISYLRQNALQPRAEAVMNSETPGSIIDRLSINALKIYHMLEETLRMDVDEDHQARCQAKVDILREQRKDLGQCLKELIQDLMQGQKLMKVYYQMKMYNDATLNPILYKKRGLGHDK